MSRKADILSAATQLFAEKGFTETTTLEIAEKAGVAHGTLFYHFKSKLGIIHDIFKHAGDTFLEGIHTAVSVDLTGIEKIDAIIRYNTTFGKHHAQQIKIFLRDVPDQLTNENPLRTLVHSVQTEVLTVIRDCLAEGCRDGTIVCSDPDRTAHVVHSLIFGLTYMHLSSPLEMPDLTGCTTMFCRRALTPAAQTPNSVITQKENKG